MRNVGDMHLQLPVPAFESLYVHRIVKIARGFTVYRYNRQIAKVATTGAFRIVHGTRHARCFRQHFGRKFMRQMMFPDQDLYVHAEFAGASQNFDHASGRRHAAARKARHLHVDDGAIQLRQPHAALWRVRAQLRLHFRRQFIAWRNNDFVQQSRFVRCDRISARSVPEQAHNGRVRPADHTQDAPFGTRRPSPIAKPLAALHAREHMIAVHGVANSVAPDEKIALQIFSRRVRHDEAIPVTVRDEASR